MFICQSWQYLSLGKWKLSPQRGNATHWLEWQNKQVQHQILAVTHQEISLLTRGDAEQEQHFGKQLAIKSAMQSSMPAPECLLNK